MWYNGGMLDDPAVIQDIVKRLREVNPEPPPKYRYNYPKLLAYQKQWRVKNPRAAKAIKDKYYTKSEAKALAIARKHKRRTRILTAKGTFTAREWELRKQEFDYRCAYCGRKSTKLTADHYIPLSKGGTNYIDNIVPACIKCNKHKWVKDPSEFKFPRRTQMIMARLHST